MLPRLWVAAGLLGLTLLASGPPAGVPQAEYGQRRAKVQEHLDRLNGILVLYGSTEEERGDLRSRFFQDSDFYYLSGWVEPGARLILTPTAEFLFLPARNETTERYTGAKLTAESPAAAQRTGFASVLPSSRFEITLFESLQPNRKVYSRITLGDESPLKGLLGKRPIESAAAIIHPLRLRKSASELALLERAVDVSIRAHRAAWTRAAAGLFEYQIAATMMNVYLEAGCERSAYPPIVGSGPNAIVLHYNRNSRRMDSGEMLLMDVGGECSMYAADITRTIPINGRFTPRQREIYDIVLGAQRAAIAAVKPGMNLAKEGDKSLYKVALEYINTHGKSLSGEPLGKYFTHGLGHHIGLDVHDPGLPSVPLEAGHVITIEPGLYIPEEGIGVRIEDMVLVTESGARVLTRQLPSEPGQLEKLLDERRR